MADILRHPRMVPCTHCRGTGAEPSESPVAEAVADFDALCAARNELERRIDDLRMFEREYSARLKAALEADANALEVHAAGIRGMMQRFDGVPDE